MKAISEKELENSIIEQLKSKGADVSLYRDLIRDYLFFCKQEKKMQASIKRDGMTYQAVSSQGKIYEKENPAVKNAIVYNRQKLAILAQLGLTTNKIDIKATVEDDSGL